MIIIPARMASTRFPDKPLAFIKGKTMIERVFAIGKASKLAKDVVIATDDERLRDFATNFGARVVMTSSNCLTGTDRVAEAMDHFPEHTIFFSLQGDAVLTPPWVIDQVLIEMQNDPEVEIATPAVRLHGEALKDFVESKRLGSSSGTAVVFDHSRNALYFSKSLIPYSRDGNAPIYRHIGLYGYRKEALKKLSKIPEGAIERAEKLEQLRALENGMRIRVVEVDYALRTHGSVDRPEDISVVESIIEKEGELL